MTIETERLLLRPFEVFDAADVYENTCRYAILKKEWVEKARGVRKGEFT